MMNWERSGSKDSALDWWDCENDKNLLSGLTG
jgi:hypothetical protein